MFKNKWNYAAGNYRQLKYNIRVKHRGWNFNVCLKTNETKLLETTENWSIILEWNTEDGTLMCV